MKTSLARLKSNFTKDKLHENASREAENAPKGI